jgi:hypothetical protein
VLLLSSGAPSGDDRLALWWSRMLWFSQIDRCLKAMIL